MDSSDKHTSLIRTKRIVPMEILVLGMCRTGTQSLADALEILGFKGVYHMREVFKSGHGQYWISALEAKYEGKGKTFGREEFDEFLGGWAGVSDIPAALFPDELIAAYPEAKVILTTRDEDKWFDSMKATIWHLHEARKAALPKGQTPSIPLRLLDLEHEHIWAGDPEKFGKVKYREHNEHVRNVAQKGRFFDYQVQQGWGPLCEFLGKNIPEEDFPRADDWLSYKKEHVIQKLPDASG